MYAVWVRVSSIDTRDQWDASILADPRVTQLYDGKLVAARYFARAGLGVGAPGGIAWDVYLLFGPDSRWGGRPSELISSGGTVIGRADRLEADFERLLR